MTCFLEMTTSSSKEREELGMIELGDFGEELPFDKPGYMESFLAAVGSDQFKDAVKLWGKGAATAAALTVVAYTVRFLGREVSVPD
jgi:hypothetical protein